MLEAHQQRWQQIQSFAFTPPDAAITFVDKLISETGWTRHDADAAIAEYRRFLLLAAVAGHPVGPSPVVDQVWHLHLLYTRSYWRDLCPNVLGFDFHHEPATGTPSDRAKLNDWYALTLGSYATIFGEPPPTHVWPMRPSAAPMVQVDPQRMVVLPRGAFRLGVAFVAIVLAALFAILMLTLSRGG